MIPSKDELLALAEDLRHIAREHFPSWKDRSDELRRSAAILERLAEANVSCDGALCIREDRTAP